MIFVTAWIAAPLMILIALLGVRISLLRLGGKALSDDKATVEGFTRWQRAHGNAVEHVPLVLLLLFLLELAHGRRGAVMVMGVTFLAARLLHVYGSIIRVGWAKRSGATLTYMVELAVGVLLLTKMIQTL
jgi:uncharacterized membrane protein YecN with MAPEG domain